jgi:hypothetical protein
MIIIPVNGVNSRMGSLFKTPKHLLLVEGKPAILQTLDYVDDGVPTILAGEAYADELESLCGTQAFIERVPVTRNQVETIKHCSRIKGDLWIIDCDIVPVDLPDPGHRTTAYCFKNQSGLNHYSNFQADEDGRVVACNEKEQALEWAGAGVYYFKDADEFWNYSQNGEETIAQVMEHMVKEGRDPVYVNTDNYIIRLGTLPDITGGFTGNILERKITKKGSKVMSEKLWYLNYEDKADIPRLYEGDALQLTMEYIERNAILDIAQVFHLIRKYRQYKAINRLQFDSYIQRIESHLSLNFGISNGVKLLKRLRELGPLAPTFAHGDLSTTNVIPTKEGMKLIDPLYSVDVFGSYILDYAKFLFSLKFYANDREAFDQFMALINREDIEVLTDIETLIASESVRVATYNKKFNFIAENLIHEL